jgi:AAA family ATP:ADP antiporter
MQSRPLIHRLVFLKPGETEALLWSAGYYFCLLSAYYVLKPIRDAFGIDGSLTKLPWLWTGTTAAMLAAAPVFAAVVSRFPRRKFIPATYRFFALNILAWYALLLIAPQSASRGIGYAFFIWASVFNLFAVSVFWGFMADAFTNEQGKRLFGAIAVGGTLGAMFGSSIPALLATRLGPIHVMLASVLLLELAVQCIYRLIRHFGIAEDSPSPARGAEPSPKILEGIRLIATSPYLLLMAVYMLLFTMTTTFLEFERLAVIQREFPTKELRTQALGWVELIVNTLTLLTQLFLTGRFVTRFGVRPALVFLPILTLVGFLMLWVWHEPGIASAETSMSAYAIMVLGFFILRRSMHFAVDRPTREVLYTVLGPDEKYKSKSFIDTVVYRGGDLIGAWSNPLLAKLGVAVAAVAAGVSVVWACSGVGLGILHHRIAARKAGQSGNKTGESVGAASPDDNDQASKPVS